MKLSKSNHWVHVYNRLRFRVNPNQDGCHNEANLANTKPAKTPLILEILQFKLAVIVTENDPQNYTLSAH